MNMGVIISLQDPVLNFFLVFKKKFFWPHSMACGILIPQPGIKLMSPAVEARSLNHWTAREVPSIIFNVYPEVGLLGYMAVLFKKF